MPNRDDPTYPRVILEQLREIRGSLRSARQESHDFREEIVGRVVKLETDLAVNTALTQQKTTGFKVLAWLIGTAVGIAAIAVPIYLSR